MSKPRRHGRRFAFCLFALSTSACGGSEDGLEEEQELPDGVLRRTLSITGVYELTSLVRSEDDCESAGSEEITDLSQRWLFVRDAVVSGKDIAQAYSCLDANDCKGKAQAASQGQPFLFAFGYSADSIGPEPGELVGVQAIAGNPDGQGQCSDGVLVRDRFLPSVDSRLLIESRRSLVASYPSAADGTCGQDEVLKQDPAAQTCIRVDRASALFRDRLDTSG